MGLCAGLRTIFDEPLEILRRDANDGLGMAIEHNGFADNGGIAGEAFFPETVTENDDVVVAGLAVFGSEARAEEEIDTEEGKEIDGDVLDGNFLGVTVSGEIVALVKDVGHAGENGIADLPIEKIRRGDGVVRVGVLRIIFPDHNQAGGIVIGQGANENGIYHGEDGGVGADTEGQSEDGDGGEAGTALQNTQGVTKIARSFVEPGDDVGVASVFFEERGVAEAFLSLVARLGGRHTGGEIVSGAHFEMGPELCVEIATQSSVLE